MRVGWLLLLWFAGWTPVWADEAELRVVVAPTAGVQHLTPAELQAIFSLRTRTWPSGAPVRVVVFPDQNPLHELFCTRYLKLVPFQLRHAWDRLVYSGMGRAPEVVSSVEAMRARVATTPGSIGYLPQGAIDDSVRALP